MIERVCFELKLCSGNAALVHDHQDELSAILRRVARAVESGDTAGTVSDSNGNAVGSWYVELTDDGEGEG